MCSTVLPCPLCCKTNFDSIDALKISLVTVTKRPLNCPICYEVLLGLDKLTIHLFGHSMDVDDPVKNNKDVGKIKITANNSSESAAIAQTNSVSSANSPTHKRNKPNSRSQSIRSPSSTKVEKSMAVPSAENCSVKCEICDFVFENAKHLSMHMNLVHVQPGGPPEETSTATKFPCHLCNKSFKMKGSLRVHLKVVHMHGFQNICKNINTDDSRSLNESNYDPSMLNKQTMANNTTPDAIVQIKTDEPQASTINMNKSLGAEVEPKISPDQSKSWECDICTKTFTTKYFLKKHKRLHTGN